LQVILISFCCGFNEYVMINFPLKYREKWLKADKKYIYSVNIRPGLGKYPKLPGCITSQAFSDSWGMTLGVRLDARLFFP